LPNYFISIFQVLTLNKLSKLFYICRISRLGLYYFAQLLTPPGKSARFAEQILLTVNTNIRLVWGNLKSQREAKEVGLEKLWGTGGKFTPFAES